MRAQYVAAARVELSEAARYYGDTSDRLALGFMREVETAVERVLTLPESAPILHTPVRRKMLRKFPYSLLYYVPYLTVPWLQRAMHRRWRRFLASVCSSPRWPLRGLTPSAWPP